MIALDPDVFAKVWGFKSATELAEAAALAEAELSTPWTMDANGGFIEPASDRDYIRVNLDNGYVIPESIARYYGAEFTELLKKQDADD